MIKRNEVARGVRVKLNENWFEKSLSDRYLIEESVIFIKAGTVFNDERGEYVWLEGGSHLNSGYAYLDQLDLEFPYDKPLYTLYEEN